CRCRNPHRTRRPSPISRTQHACHQRPGTTHLDLPSTSGGRQRRGTPGQAHSRLWDTSITRGGTISGSGNPPAPGAPGPARRCLACGGRGTGAFTPDEALTAYARIRAAPPSSPPQAASNQAHDGDGATGNSGTVTTSKTLRIEGGAGYHGTKGGDTDQGTHSNGHAGGGTAGSNGGAGNTGTVKSTGGKVTITGGKAGDGSGLTQHGNTNSKPGADGATGITPRTA
ncbi:hypothetical protein ABZ766_15515, partial [Streptomyces sp. NPDC006670]